MPKVVIQAVETNTLLDPGTYPARIVKGSAGFQGGGKHNGAEKVDVWLRVAEQVTIKESLIWVPSMMWKVNKFAAACGYGRPGDEVMIDGENVVGRSCVVTVYKDEITDKSGAKRIINKISEFQPGTGKIDDFLSDDEP